MKLCDTVEVAIIVIFRNIGISHQFTDKGCHLFVVLFLFKKKVGDISCFLAFKTEKDKEIRLELDKLSNPSTCRPLISQNSTVLVKTVTLCKLFF